jgi:exonuclease III
LLDNFSQSILKIVQYSVLLLLGVLSSLITFSQNNFTDDFRGNTGIRIAFYNVENLFDIENDPLKRDDEFTEKGDKHWNDRKYRTKLHQISKVAVSVGGWEALEVVAFCELENRRVLEDLLSSTPLKEAGYKIVHFESPDRRGIDVGFIYLPEKIQVIHSEAIPIVFPWDDKYKTRDILYARLVILKVDTIDFYVNHWPSRWGGQLETEDARMHVAKTLLSHRNSLASPQKMIAVGDFNDSPIDRSIKDVFKAELDTSVTAEYYNLMYPHLDKQGTNKYQGSWSIIDQFIVSESLFNSKNGLQIKNKSANIFNADYLLEPDPKYEGMQLNRTYLGMRYKGGYSDHLPIYLDLVK